MREPKVQDARPYHHGDLRRALVAAARALLEREGAAALSLRAVAREAGVSPAAPYHHFKDKSELLEAVADEGWLAMNHALGEGSRSAPPGQDRLIWVLVAYVSFAREQPALYRLMYDAARNRESLPLMTQAAEVTAYTRVRANLAAHGAPATDTEVELVIAAAWCAAHGLAEMAGFKQFEHLKTELGGEKPFLAAVLQRMRLYQAGLLD
jgi:AcrR family transcriptional regulator